MYHQVDEVDYVRDITVVDVRYRTGSGITERSLGKQLLAVKR
jgi:hypothetical protein